ncbi:MAG TPA: tryptophan synthase subunit alpha [Chitinophagaceae bacterium]
MADRLKKLFEQKKRNVLSVYCTAGFPLLEDTVATMKALEQNGVDMIELGVPYSDPLADGPVIQDSSSVALRNGMTIELLFKELQKFRETVSIPVLLMGYINPVLQFGFERFCREAARVGIDGLILPDLPEHEFETNYRDIIQRSGLNFVFLVTPETAPERIRRLDSLSSGFLYAVSSSSTTGKEKDLAAVENYLVRLRAMNLQNPIIVGFGIRDRESFQAACRHANGAIIGTAYIKALSGQGTIEEKTANFLRAVTEPAS